MSSTSKVHAHQHLTTKVGVRDEPTCPALPPDEEPYSVTVGPRINERDPVVRSIVGGHIERIFRNGATYHPHP